MTTRKITDLTRLEEPEDNDDLLIRDTSEVEDKRVSVEDLFAEPTVRTLQFDTGAGEQADEEGKLVWRDQDSSLAYRADGIVIDVGQENVVLIRNDTGATLPKGAAVCVAGSSAQRLSVTLSDASPGAGGCRTLGIVAEEIPDNAFGFVSTFGLLRGVDTSAFDEGDELFISTTPGVLTATPPESPARRVTVGYVVVDGVGNGAIFVTLRRGLTLDEVDDVHAPAPQDGQVLRYVDAEDRYEAETLAAADVGAEPDGAVASHSAETEGIHGIADTSELETQAGAQSKVDDRVPDPDGEPDGRVLTTDDGGIVFSTPLYGPISFQRTSGTGEFDRIRCIVATPGSLADRQLVQGSVRGHALVVSQNFRAFALAANVTSAGSSGSVIRLGLWVFDDQGGVGSGTMTLVQDFGTVSGETDGYKVAEVSPFVVPPGLYFVGAVGQGAPATQPTLSGFPTNSAWSPLSMPSSATPSSTDITQNRVSPSAWTGVSASLSDSPGSPWASVTSLAPVIALYGRTEP